MTDKFYLENEFIRQNAISMVKRAPLGYLVEVKQETRSLAQNRKLWSCLTDIANQVEWHGRFLSKHDWKNICTAGLTKAESVPGIEDGTFVMIGSSTSNMTKKLFIDLVEYIHWFGSGRNVIWSRGAIDVFEEYLKDNKNVFKS